MADEENGGRRRDIIWRPYSEDSTNEVPETNQASTAQGISSLDVELPPPETPEPARPLLTKAGGSSRTSVAYTSSAPIQQKKARVPAGTFDGQRKASYSAHFSHYVNDNERTGVRHPLSSSSGEHLLHSTGRAAMEQPLHLSEKNSRVPAGTFDAQRQASYSAHFSHYVNDNERTGVQNPPSSRSGEHLMPSTDHAGMEQPLHQSERNSRMRGHAEGPEIRREEKAGGVIVPGGEKPHACCHCDRKYKNKRDLTRHLRQCGPYKCDSCASYFKTPLLLSSHACSGPKKKRYMCEECDKWFSHRSGLRDHRRVHTGEARFECSVCRAKYAYSQGLRQHMKRHSDKKYECTLCHAKLSSNRSLRRHRREQHDHQTD